MKNRRPTLTVISIILLLATLFSLAPVSYAAEPESNSINSIMLTKNRDEIEIKAAFTKDFVASNSGVELCLFELLPYQSTLRINELLPIATCKLTSEVSLRVNFAENAQARLFAKYVFAIKKGEGYTCVTNAYFIENPESLAQNSFDYPKTASKKGLAIQLLSDAQELGVGHTTLTIPINEYLCESRGESGGSGTLSYIFDNKSYYIDRAKLDLLDHRIKVMSDAGINIYLNLVLTPPTEATPASIRALYCENADPNASLMALNTKVRESVLYLEGFVTFLAERYTRPDREYGFAGSFILGYEANNNRKYNSMGEATMDAYLNAYVTAFRIVSTAARSVYSNARLYLPLANNWTSEVADKNETPNASLEYAGAAFIDSFNKKLAYSGQIPWGVAISAYPSDHAMVKFWEDEDATPNRDTPYLTMANLEVLVELLRNDEYKYNGSTRSILVSDFALTSGGITSGGGSADEQALQAASYAAAYIKAASFDEVEALIYHRQVDHAGEGGYSFGLWTRLDGTTVTPHTRKPIYNIFKYVDTDSFAELEGELLSSLDINAWSDILGAGAKQTETRKIVETIPVSSADIPDSFDERRIVSFERGNLFGFYPSDNAEYIELRANPDSEEHTSVLYAGMYHVGSSEYMGIENIFDEPLKLERGGYITLRIKTVFPEGVDTADIMLRLARRDMSFTYEGVATLTSGQWQDVTFKIDALAEVGGIDVMKLWMRPTGDITTSGELGLWLDTVTVYDRVDAAWWQILLRIILILVIIAAILFAALIIYNQIRVRKIKKEAARREAMRRRRMAAQSSQALPPRVRPEERRPQMPPEQRRNEAPPQRSAQQPRPDAASRPSAPTGNRTAGAPHGARRVPPQARRTPAPKIENERSEQNNEKRNND